jgi:hypothetical protein
MPGTSTKSFSVTRDRRGKVPEQSACGAKSNPSVMTVMRLTRSDD